MTIEAWGARIAEDARQTVRVARSGHAETSVALVGFFLGEELLRQGLATHHGSAQAGALALARLPPRSLVACEEVDALGPQLFDAFAELLQAVGIPPAVESDLAIPPARRPQGDLLAHCRELRRRAAAYLPADRTERVKSAMVAGVLLFKSTALDAKTIKALFFHHVVAGSKTVPLP